MDTVRAGRPCRCWPLQWRRRAPTCGGRRRRWAEGSDEPSSRFTARSVASRTARFTCPGAGGGARGPAKPGSASRRGGDIIRKLGNDAALAISSAGSPSARAANQEADAAVRGPEAAEALNAVISRRRTITAWAACCMGVLARSAVRRAGPRHHVRTARRHTGPRRDADVGAIRHVFGPSFFQAHARLFRYYCWRRCRSRSS